VRSLQSSQAQLASMPHCALSLHNLVDAQHVLMATVCGSRSMPLAASQGHDREETDARSGALQDRAEQLAASLMKMESLVPSPSMQTSKSVSVGTNADTIGAQAAELYACAEESLPDLPSGSIQWCS
jgi:hypothetical protein